MSTKNYLSDSKYGTLAIILQKCLTFLITIYGAKILGNIEFGLAIYYRTPFLLVENVVISSIGLELLKNRASRNPHDYILILALPGVIISTLTILLLGGGIYIATISGVIGVFSMFIGIDNSYHILESRSKNLLHHYGLVGTTFILITYFLSLLNIRLNDAIGYLYILLIINSIDLFIRTIRFKSRISPRNTLSDIRTKGFITNDLFKTTLILSALLLVIKTLYARYYPEILGIYEKYFIVINILLISVSQINILALRLNSAQNYKRIIRNYKLLIFALFTVGGILGYYLLEILLNVQVKIDFFVLVLLGGILQAFYSFESKFKIANNVFGIRFIKYSILLFFASTLLYIFPKYGIFFLNFSVYIVTLLSFKKKN